MVVLPAAVVDTSPDVVVVSPVVVSPTNVVADVVDDVLAEEVVGDDVGVGRVVVVRRVVVVWREVVVVARVVVVTTAVVVVAGACTVTVPAIATPWIVQW